MVINNYGELKQWVAKFADRDDIAEQIPLFIGFAERSIFRNIRIPANEKVANFEVTIETEIPVPSDFLEARSITVNGEPLKRISDIALIERDRSGDTRYFAREGGVFKFSPELNSGDVIRLNYWFDDSGMTLDTDTTTMLRVAPDLYIYGALMEIDKYLGAEERIAQNRAIFDAKLSELQTMEDKADMSGSTLEIQNGW